LCEGEWRRGGREEYCQGEGRWQSQGKSTHA
jgi:hypothetical protein